MISRFANTPEKTLLSLNIIKASNCNISKLAITTNAGQYIFFPDMDSEYFLESVTVKAKEFSMDFQIGVDEEVAINYSEGCEVIIEKEKEADKTSYHFNIKSDRDAIALSFSIKKEDGAE